VGSVFHCNVCDVSTTDDTSLHQHLAGRPHKRKLEQEDREARRQRRELVVATAASSAAASSFADEQTAEPAPSLPVVAAASSSSQRCLPSPLARLVAYIDDLYDGLLGAATVVMMVAMQLPPLSREDAVRQRWATVMLSPASQTTRDCAVFIARNRIACMPAADCTRLHVSAAEQTALQLQMLQRAFFLHSSLAMYPVLLRRAATLAVRHELVGQLLERDVGSSRAFRGHNYYAMGQLADHLLAQAADPSPVTHALLHQYQMSATARGRRYSDSDLPRPGLQTRTAERHGLPQSHPSDLALLEDTAALSHLQLDSALFDDDNGLALDDDSGLALDDDFEDDVDDELVAFVVAAAASCAD
jgi:hypothetical protein